MKIIRRQAQMGAEVAAARGHFTGEVDQRQLAAQPDAKSVSVSLVRFQPGARTHWHVHLGGQVLHVTEGRGRIQVEDAPVQEIAGGDIVVAEPGRKHWHGAAENSSMTHISVAIGGIEWHDPA